MLRHHAEVIDDIHAVVMALLAEVKNLRSQVTRSALSGIGDVFVFAPRMVEQVNYLLLFLLLIICEVSTHHGMKYYGDNYYDDDRDRARIELVVYIISLILKDDDMLKQCTFKNLDVDMKTFLRLCFFYFIDFVSKKN